MSRLLLAIDTAGGVHTHTPNNHTHTLDPFCISIMFASGTPFSHLCHLMNDAVVVTLFLGGVTTLFYLRSIPMKFDDEKVSMTF